MKGDNVRRKWRRGVKDEERGWEETVEGEKEGEETTGDN